MLGQAKLLSTIQRYIDTSSFPRTLLLEGKWGCGKHTLCHEIAQRMQLELSDITNTLTLDTLQEISTRPTPYIYLIDASSISVKEQNIILKFLEEPLKNSYIIVLCESRYKLLPTVLNRCQTVSFEEYSELELLSIVKQNVEPCILSIAHTPGMLFKLLDSPTETMISLATQIFEKLCVASYSNALTIPYKLYYKAAKESLLEFNLFVYVLLHISYEFYKQNKITLIEYQLTDTLYNDCQIKNIDKQKLFEHYIISMKRYYEGVIPGDI